jgi:hypothetical protein
MLPAFFYSSPFFANFAILSNLFGKSKYFLIETKKMLSTERIYEFFESYFHMTQLYFHDNVQHFHFNPNCGNSFLSYIVK